VADLVDVGDPSVASIVAWPWARMRSMQSAIQSTCCSIETIMLLSTDGLPGPVIANRLGKPATASPRYVRGPSAHASCRVRPPRPRMSMPRSAPVIASKPVANTMLSSVYAASRVLRPSGVIASIGARRISTRVTLSRLNVS
jgi:hypothetical protein